MSELQAYRADASLRGKVRRQVARFSARRPLAAAPGRPMISFSFDDAPASAARAGAEILEARGLRGTYYVASDLAGQQLPMGTCAGRDDYLRLLEAGHELGCHTSGHLDCGRTAPPVVDRDLARNAAVLRAWGERDLTSFAYPYGDVAPGVKQMLGARFSTVRALHHGVVEKGSDLNQAPAVGIEGPGGEAAVRRWMKVALDRKAWLIVYTHDVAADPSPWGCTPQALARLADEALALGFETGAVRDIARKVGL